MEIWKDIEEFEGLYQVSNLGRVKSLERYVNHKRYKKQLIKERIIKPTLSFDKYYYVGLYKNGNVKNVTIHRLVCLSFLQKTNKKKEVNHKNGIKTDNRVENLEWCTRSHNILHAFKNGLKHGPKGEKNGKSKLTEKEVIKIKYSYKELNVAEIAKIYNVTETASYDITSNKSWKHI